MLSLLFVHRLICDLQISGEQAVFVEVFFADIFRYVGNMEADADVNFVVLVLGLYFRCDVIADVSDEVLGTDDVIVFRENNELVAACSCANLVVT